MSFIDEINKSQKSYQKEWSFTSEFYYAQGYYERLTSSLNDNLKILEIGSGSGFSTINLCKKASKLYSVDENKYCIKETFDRLIKNNIPATLVERGSILSNEEVYSYKLEYEDIFPTSKNLVYCIEGNILFDSSLISHLKSIENFDLITCWMIGAHGLILNHEEQLLKNRSAFNTTPQMVQDYKFEVIEKVSEVSQIILNQEGLLNIVERVNLEFVKHYGINDIVDIYNEKIEPFGFSLFETCEILEIETKSTMAMVTSNGKVRTNKLGLLNLKYKKTNANNL
ncbi:hypothetical protein [uncultured Draconibacterium sp.]|uniref:hypothetical protein n=1 Tax=uncultured Draconibacterium sp. TaxID=1573823 RepID=UPI00262F9D92|nr:hypothetical protein [uncultured Draconibacterium sp.]